MRRTNVRHGKDIMHLIYLTSNSLVGVSSIQVVWSDWKSFLDHYFTVLAAFK